MLAPKVGGRSDELAEPHARLARLDWQAGRQAGTQSYTVALFQGCAWASKWRPAIFRALEANQLYREAPPSFVCPYDETRSPPRQPLTEEAKAGSCPAAQCVLRQPSNSTFSVGSSWQVIPGQERTVFCTVDQVHLNCVSQECDYDELSWLASRCIHTYVLVVLREMCGNTHYGLL